MAKNNNYNSRSNSYDNRNNNNTPVKKHTGCKYINSDKNGNPCTVGWNYSRANGLVSFLACVYSANKEKGTKGSDVHESPKSGRKWINVMVKVSPKMAKPFIVSGMMDQATGAVTISELGLIMNPKAPNGGYCGKFGSK